MNREIQILRGKTEVEIQGTLVEVKELTWTEALEFFERAAEGLVQLADEQGQIHLTPDTFRELLRRSHGLTQWLLYRATSLDVPTIELLPIRDLLRLLDAALELNLSDEVLELGKRVARRFGGFLGAEIKADGSQSASPSSRQVSLGQTSTS